MKLGSEITKTYTQNRIDNLIVKSPKAILLSKETAIRNGKLITTNKYSNAHIVSDSLLLQLNK